MIDLINRFQEDPKGILCSKLSEIKNAVLTFYSTRVGKLKMSINGVQYGNKITIRGKIMFFRTPKTKIVIGDNVVFNSLSRFNHRGINHECILETIDKGFIIIGNNCSFSGVSIVSSIGVEIGCNVMCGANVMIADRDGHQNKYPQFSPKRVIIQDNVWVGMNSVVMKGVTIGENSIIGANSLVTKDIPANCIAAGIPCKVIKYRK